MFLGESTYKVDEKGRVPIPPKFRDELQKGMVLTQGVDPCLCIYPLSEFEKVRAGISAQPGNAMGRRLKRFVFAKAIEARIDRIGRVPIPEWLRKYAGITDTAIIIGQNLYAEIWSPENWQVESDGIEKDAWQIAEIVESQKTG